MTWEKADQVRAYLIYTIGGGAPRTLQVRSVHYVDRQAWEAMWHFIYNHEAQAGRVRYTSPVQDPLFTAIADWETARVEIKKAHLVRCADPAALLDGFPIPGGVKGEMALRVTDPMGSGKFRDFTLQLGSGRIVVTVEHAPARLVLDTGALAQIVTGHAGVDRLQFLGRIEGSEENLRLLDAAFPVLRSPLLWEAF